MDSLGFWLDVMIVLLLIPTLSYAVALNRSLTRFREGREELDGLVKRLGESIGRAETSIRALKGTSAEAGDELAVEVKKARDLLDEMTIITEAANGIADRLERAATGARRASEAAEAQVAQQAQPATNGRAPLKAVPKAGQPPRTAPPPREEPEEAAAPRRAAAVGRSRAERELAEKLESLNRGDS